MAMLVDFQDRHFSLDLRAELEALLEEYLHAIQPGSAAPPGS